MGEKFERGSLSSVPEESAMLEQIMTIEDLLAHGKYNATIATFYLAH